MAETVNPLLGRGQKIGSNTEVPILLRGGGGGARGPSNPVDYAADLAKAAAEAPPPGLRAYHGSPYEFERFDSSKIGTGEGAQAYGRGLYFAENEGVAKQYRSLADVKANEQTPFGAASRALASANGDANAALASLEGNLKGLRASAAKDTQTPPEYYAKRIPEYEQAIELVKGGKVNPAGRTYEVNIRAKPEEMLDWDKPIGEQPHLIPKLNAAGFPVGKGTDFSYLEKMAAEHGPESWYAMQLTSLKNEMAKPGGDFVQLLKDPATVEKLRAAGIKGVRFLDQGSRGKGEGTSNYVVFDDKIIDILKKYGIAGLMGSGAGVAALAGAAPPAQASEQPPPDSSQPPPDYYGALKGPAT